MTDATRIIDFFYAPDDPAREILLQHSFAVQQKALRLLEISTLNCRIDRETVSIGALLHDIGIRFCNAPDIGCFGENPYIAHGIIGAEMLRSYGKNNHLDLEKFARICERHTGSGLTAAEIRERSMPLPEKDLMPETVEEKLITLADKFFSKSGSNAEKPLDKVRSSIAKFGSAPLARLDNLFRECGIDPEF